MNDFNPMMISRMKNAPKEVTDMVADIMIESILSSSIPEESKIEVRIMKICRDIEATVNKAMNDFALPIPPTEEGKEVQRKAFPARQAFLEYLQLMKGGLDTFLQQVPAPDIPPEYKDIPGRLKGL